MSVWMIVLLVAHILIGIVLIGLVLLQQGKGADMGASFGSGASGSIFGAAGSANFLSRSTAVLAALFFASTLMLTMQESKRSRVPASVMENTLTIPKIPGVSVIVDTSGTLPAQALPGGLATDNLVPKQEAPATEPAKK